jgi:hypothetical protein
MYCFEHCLIQTWIRIETNLDSPVLRFRDILGPDPAIFAIELQDANKKLSFLSFYAYYFLKGHLYHFSKIKSHKEVTKSRNQGFS